MLLGEWIQYCRVHSLMIKITEPAEQEQILHSAKVFYQLYAGIFRSLDVDMALAA